MNSSVKKRIELCLNKTGVSFYKDIILALSEEMNIDYILVGKVFKEKKLVQSIVFAKENMSFNAVNYNITNTPCENTVKEGVLIHISNVAKLYPKDDLLTEMEIEGYTGVSLKIGNERGLLVGLSITEIKNSKDLVEIFSLYSAKFGDELNKHGMVLLDPVSYL
jgi:hypothetical protein